MSYTDSSALETAKSWVAQQTIHSWRLDVPSQFWLVRQSTGTMKSIDIYISEFRPLSVVLKPYESMV